MISSITSNKMEGTIKFLEELEIKCYNLDCGCRCHRSVLEITKIDSVPVSVFLAYYVKEKFYKLEIHSDEPSTYKTLFEKKYTQLNECYRVENLANELKDDFTKMKYSKMEDAIHTEPFEENLLTISTNFLCSGNPLISTLNSIQECGICFEQTKRKIDCCNNIICYPCEVKIIKKPFHNEEFQCCEARPCPFCRRVINTSYIFDEEDED